METFASDLETAMKRAGLSAAELAARSGMTESAISYLRSGQRSPSLRSVRKLATVLPELDTAAAQPGAPTPGFDRI